MNSATEFFAKYPAINECWQSPDGQLHFNKMDAELHSRIRDLSGEIKKIKKSSKKL